MPIHLQTKFIELQCASIYKNNHIDCLQEFYKTLDRQTHNNLIEGPLQTFNMFGKTYIYEQTFLL